MSKLEFIKKLYNGKNCYSDHMKSDEINMLHIKSSVEDIIAQMLAKKKIVFLTGNPGDGKTFLIKYLDSTILENVYIETDLNNIDDYSGVVQNLIECYCDSRPAIIAVNEYPFMKLCKEIKNADAEMYKDICSVKKNSIAYNISGPLNSRIAVIDLNERNLLGEDYSILEQLVDKMAAMLSEEDYANSFLEYNIKAIKNQSIKKQLLSLFHLAASDCEHFAVRDIVGSIAFALTACTSEDYTTSFYYDAIFQGSNELLRKVQSFDPVYLSCPDIDEKLWNGDIVDGWLIETPIYCPAEIEDIAEAVSRFKSLKRQYYFENIEGFKLVKLQPQEVLDSIELFKSFEANKRKIKETIIKSINKLFLPSFEDKKRLHIWTTHRYDMSLSYSATVSSKSVESSDLEILLPRPADWLSGMEYVPDHIILKHVSAEQPTLIIDVDFLWTLNAIEHGYPIGLLASHYEQSAAMFLQQLDDNDLAEENDDGETIIASRKFNLTKTIRIQDGKYGFEEDEE